MLLGLQQRYNQSTISDATFEIRAWLATT